MPVHSIPVAAITLSSIQQRRKEHSSRQLFFGSLAGAIMATEHKLVLRQAAGSNNTHGQSNSFFVPAGHSNLRSKTIFGFHAAQITRRRFQCLYWNELAQNCQVDHTTFVGVNGDNEYCPYNGNGTHSLGYNPKSLRMGVPPSVIQPRLRLITVRQNQPDVLGTVNDQVWAWYRNYKGHLQWEMGVGSKPFSDKIYLGT